MMCVEVSKFEVSATAGWYSAVAGLLAGFALLAVLLPLDHQAAETSATEDESGADGVVVFTSSFFALLILSFTYAVLAGRTSEGATQGIARHEQQLNGAAFGLASLLLLLGLNAVLRLYGGNARIFEPGRRLIVNVTGLYGPAIAVAFQFSNALDVGAYRATAGARNGNECQADVSLGTWINLTVSILAIAALVALAWLHQRMPHRSGAAAIVGRTTLGFTIAVAVWTALIVPFLPVSFITGSLLEHLVLTLNAVGCVAFGAAARLSR
ncbi:hypothetical protein [Streptomyces sp. NPDC055749]